MIITAISDIHGFLPDIPESDLLLVCGDWSPLEIQTDFWSMHEWLNTVLLPWFKSLSVLKIIFIAGNHDFICDSKFLYLDSTHYFLFDRDFLYPLLRAHGLTDKVKYLCNSSTLFNNLRIYGCPYVEGCIGWAFSQADIGDIYSKIKKCDILITHQPPMYNGVGRTVAGGIEREFGSFSLLNVIQKKKPHYFFCGHIHNGDHSQQIYYHSDVEKTVIYNCAIKDEDYNPTHSVLTIEI